MVGADELVCRGRDAGDSDTGQGIGTGNWCPLGLRDRRLVSLVSLWAEVHGAGVSDVPLG